MNGRPYRDIQRALGVIESMICLEDETAPLSHTLVETDSERDNFELCLMQAIYRCDKRIN